MPKKETRSSQTRPIIRQCSCRYFRHLLCQKGPQNTTPPPPQPKKSDNKGKTPDKENPKTINAAKSIPPPTKQSDSKKDDGWKTVDKKRRKSLGADPEY